MPKKPLTVAAVELRTWMTVQKKTAKDFARLCGSSENSVMKWRNGYTVPLDSMRLTIESATGGMVRLVDWSLPYAG